MDVSSAGQHFVFSLPVIISPVIYIHIKSSTVRILYWNCSWITLSLAHTHTHARMHAHNGNEESISEFGCKNTWKEATWGPSCGLWDNNKLYLAQRVVWKCWLDLCQDSTSRWIEFGFLSSMQGLDEFSNYQLLKKVPVNCPYLEEPIIKCLVKWKGLCFWLRSS
jgi:hypothetical protein